MNKLGFGFLRIPFLPGTKEPDQELVNQLVDTYLDSGHRYFDTAYTYMGGKNEVYLRKALVERHERSSFQIADKLPGYLCKTYEDCERYFREQLERCGVTYFDTYMLHWLTAEHYEIAEKCDEFRFLRELKQRGLARRIGFSYHDCAEVLDRILSDHPEVDVVQLQINYLDWDSAGVQARACYEVCVKHGKQVIVMEPVKGGTLSNVPAEVGQLLDSVHAEWSPSVWALQFVTSLPQVEIVLSGMNAMEQLKENLQDLPALNDAEIELLQKAAQMINRTTAVPCTGCRYCVDHCPKHIPIPDYFRLFNEIKRYPQDDWKIEPVYHQVKIGKGMASDCIACESCKKHCPQKLPIPEYMKQVADRFGS